MVTKAQIANDLASNDLFRNTILYYLVWKCTERVQAQITSSTPDLVEENYCSTFLQRVQRSSFNPYYLEQACVIAANRIIREGNYSNPLTEEEIALLDAVIPDHVEVVITAAIAHEKLQANG